MNIAFNLPCSLRHAIIIIITVISSSVITFNTITTNLIILRSVSASCFMDMDISNDRVLFEKKVQTGGSVYFLGEKFPVRSWCADSIRFLKVCDSSIRAPSMRSVVPQRNTAITR